MSQLLQDRFPILDVEHDCILSRTGDVSIAFELQLPEIFTLSDAEYEAFHHSWVKAIRLLPEGSILHKQDWFRLDQYAADFSDPEQSALDRYSEQYFHQRPFLAHRCFLLLTRRGKNSQVKDSLGSNLLHGRLLPAELLDRKMLDDFIGLCLQFQRVLEDSGFVTARRLLKSDLLSTPDKRGLIESYFSLADSHEALQIQDLEFAEHLRIGDQYCQLYSLAEVHSLPSHCGSRIDYERYSSDRSKVGVGFAASLGQLLPCDHLYNQFIFIQPGAKTMAKLERKRLRLQSLAAYSRENLLARDATNDFLNEAITQKRQIVKAHFNLMVWSASQERLDAIKNQVGAALAKMDALPKLETVGAPQIYWAGIPGNAANFPINDSFDTFSTQACCFLNLETAYRTSNSPVGIRLGDRISGRPLHVDISDEPMQRGFCTNRNKFILGPSGSGKSFFTNHLLRSYYQQGSHIVLVDVGHSYKGLCELLSGYYFTYSEQAPLAFNPFFISPQDTLDTEKKESIKALLLALWKKDDESYSRAEYVGLSNAISGYYEWLGEQGTRFPCFDTFYDYLREGYRAQLERQQVKEGHFDIHNLLYVLRPYYRGGEFDYLLNARENLDLLHQRFIVFELDQIKGAHVMAA